MEIINLNTEDGGNGVSGFIWGTALGLAGMAGVRGAIPLLALGLLGRYTNLLPLRPGFTWLGGMGWLFLLLFLAVLESWHERIPGYSLLTEVLPIPFRLVSGGLIMLAVLGERHPFFFFFLGVLLAGAVGSLVGSLQDEIFRWAKGPAEPWSLPIQNTVALVGSLVAVILPGVMLALTVLAVGVMAWQWLRFWFPGLR